MASGFGQIIADSVFDYRPMPVVAFFCQMKKEWQDLL
jgi:hypothetical protein